jgi:hypothetical protein
MRLAIVSHLISWLRVCRNSNTLVRTVPWIQRGRLSAPLTRSALRNPYCARNGKDRKRWELPGSPSNVPDIISYHRRCNACRKPPTWVSIRGSKCLQLHKSRSAEVLLSRPNVMSSRRADTRHQTPDGRSPKGIRMSTAQSLQQPVPTNDKSSCSSRRPRPDQTAVFVSNAHCFTARRTRHGVGV